MISRGSLTECPPISEPLVRWLEAQIPARHPDLSWPERQVWYEAGRHSVVALLRRKFADQQENASVLQHPQYPKAPAPSGGPSTGPPSD